ncbi:hypothetical protein JTE90_007653, partial [Oedothorax gibbosus]
TMELKKTKDESKGKDKVKRELRIVMCVNSELLELAGDLKVPKFAEVTVEAKCQGFAESLFANEGICYQAS